MVSEIYMLHHVYIDVLSKHCNSTAVVSRLTISGLDLGTEKVRTRLATRILERSVHTGKGLFKCYVGGCKISLKKSVPKMYGSTLLMLRGGGWVGVEFPEKSVT